MASDEVTSVSRYRFESIFFFSPEDHVFQYNSMIDWVRHREFEDARLGLGGLMRLGIRYVDVGHLLVSLMLHSFVIANLRLDQHNFNTNFSRYGMELVMRTDDDYVRITQVDFRKFHSVFEKAIMDREIELQVLSDQLSDKDKEYSELLQKIEAIEATHKEDNERMRNQLRDEMLQEFEDRSKEERGEHENQFEELRQQYGAEVVKMRQQYGVEIANMRQEYESEVANMRQRHKSEIAKIMEEHAATIENNKSWKCM